MLNIGWVDFSKSDRDMVLSVLRGLTEPGAVDELGIGTVRDAFSDIFFPGTSTIQTRAKYLFLIPYICLELERGGWLSPREFIDSLEKKELDLIDILNVDGAERVIGSRSGQTLRRKPSSIYWNALRTYGFFTERLTLSEYASVFCTQRNAANKQKASGKRSRRDEDDIADDSDTGMTSTAFWRVPVFAENWRDDVTIDLTAEEAVFLREKIMSMPGTRNSLLALILRENRIDFTEFESFDDVAALRDVMPPEMWRDYCLARDFSRFVFGAQVRYNVIFSEGQNTEANDLWKKYIEERPGISLSEVQARLKPRQSVILFLKRFQSAINNEKELDALIVRREIELKGRSRAKLTNKDLYHYDIHDNNSVNMSPLSYRLFNAQRIVRDIFEGVSGNA
ncbi:hypothetical protein SDC9_49045 [bioreactor metagenome]|uniref:Uncharacterized protein n=1 Tax=bioreactor metagenome TaxID=1076179 RepID=A0A644WGC0_9ZZZZ